MKSEISITKKMLAKLREGRDRKAREAAEQFLVETEEKDNLLRRAEILMEEAVNENKKKALNEDDASDSSHEKFFEIRKDTPQFGDVRVSQEETLKKTIGENITLENDALKYYPDSNDLTLDGKINTLNMSFQFRYNDPSFGCYVWCEAMVLNEDNLRTVGKLYNAYKNWKDGITQDADLMEKLKRAAENAD